MDDLPDEVFFSVKDIIFRQAGIHLTERKRALVSARLSKRLRSLRLTNYEDYMNYALKDDSGAELIELIDAISTNVTCFFRESEHFDFFSATYAKWHEHGQKRFRVWSAGCSTGEEPYSMAIALKETRQMHGADIKILATDISSKVLKTAREGTYPTEKLETLSKPVLRTYFKAIRTKNRIDSYQVRDSLKDMILYRRLNLSSPPFQLNGPLDVIFCRNVMIYFERNTRIRLIKEFARLLKPGGLLFVGHAESLTGIDKKRFKPIRVSVYEKMQ